MKMEAVAASLTQDDEVTAFIFTKALIGAFRSIMAENNLNG